jgi:hypothetical protein
LRRPRFRHPEAGRSRQAVAVALPLALALAIARYLGAAPEVIVHSAPVRPA